MGAQFVGSRSAIYPKMDILKFEDDPSGMSTRFWKTRFDWLLTKMGMLP